MLQTTEGAYQSISDILTRMRELAVQSANDSLASTERGYVEAEYGALKNEIDRIAQVTEYNGIKLTEDAGGTGLPVTLTYQIGTRNSISGADQLEVEFNPVDVNGLFAQSGNSAGDVTTLTQSQDAIVAVDNAMEILAGFRAILGSNINKLTAAIDNLGVTVENLSAARSQIRDTDVTHESANFTKNQVLMQAGVAMLAQANATPNLAMRLLG
jgi:flagellin